MSTGAPTGAIPSATPTDDAGTTLDAGTLELNAPPVPAVSTPPTSPVPTAPPAVSTSGTGSTPDEDPVAAAIAHLARDEVPRDDKGRFAPAKPGESKAEPKASAAPTPAPAAAKPSDQPPGVDVDPYHGFDPRERDAMRQRTRERIEDIHGRWRATAKELEELKAKPAEAPVDQLDTLITEYKLDNDVQFVPADHLAGLVVSQAAVTRACLAMDQGRMPAPNDLKVATDFFGRIDEIRGRLGVNPPQQAAQQIQPFVGKLSEELQDLVDVYQIPEADVRMLAALKGMKPQPTNQQQVRPPAASAPVAPAPSPQQRPVGVDMNLLYGQRLMSDLAREGVRSDMVQAHYQVLLPLAAKLTQEKFPTVPADRIPAVFDALPPDQRYNIMVEAHRAHRGNQTKASAPVVPTPPPPATNQGPMNGSSPRAPATAANGDPVQAAIAYLSR